MESSESYEAYCITLGEALNQIITDTIRKKKTAVAGGDDFAKGYLLGFHRIINLMQQHAEKYDIPFEELGINICEEDLTLSKEE